MASAWGGAFGAAWGSAWGSILGGTPPTVTPEAPRYYSLGGMTEQHRRRLVEEDEALLAILQMFVMEEA